MPSTETVLAIWNGSGTAKGDRKRKRFIMVPSSAGPKGVLSFGSFIQQVGLGFCSRPGHSVFGSVLVRFLGF